MTEVTRREALTAAALVTLAGTAPAWAQDAGSAGPMWDLTEIFPNEAAWEAARQAALAAIPGVAKYKGRLGESADVLAEAMVLQSDLGREIGRVYTYASLKGDEDVRVSANQEKLAQARDLYTAFGEASSWATPELLTLGKDKIENFIASNATLKSRFDFDLRDTIRQAEHTLTPEGESILASVGSPLSGPSEISGQLRSSDIPWPTIKLSTGKEVRLDSQGYTLNRDAPNREDRKA
ncbi:MAG: oligoendopeptidase F, partial [Caulobacteraceae bacterium]